jgi:hypothetical protein
MWMDNDRDARPEYPLMAWIAFASVPTMFVVMLAMGQLEAWLLPRTPPDNNRYDQVRAGAGPHWEIPGAAVVNAPPLPAIAVPEFSRPDISGPEFKVREPVREFAAPRALATARAYAAWRKGAHT